MQLRFLALALSGAALATQAFAQQQVPPAPAENSAAPQQQPSSPAPTTTPVFPKQDPKNFTAATPTKETVSAFLNATWGWDESRMWQVAAIAKTPVENLSKIVIYVADKSGKEKPAGFVIWGLPDGKHIIAQDEVFPFGEHPYADNRARLQQDATGPYRGSASKDLEIIEFADFQCPHCKGAQATMDKLVADYPKARIVFQTYPLERIHPQAKMAAEYGVCVTKLGGSNAFFQFASAVFDAQEGLNTPDGATLTLNSAATKVGIDPAKVKACVANPAVADEVEKSVKLAQDMNINQTPVLMVNGRQVPIGGMPYETVKKIIDWQMSLDGIQK